MSEKKAEKTYVVETKTLRSNIETCKRTRQRLMSLLKHYVSDDDNPYQSGIIELLCEQINNVKYMVVHVNHILKEGELYKNEKNKIQGFKISFQEFTMMQNYMTINFLCEADLLKYYNISLQSC